LAKKTYNPRLGIVGGLSVLGTSGIVEPMSEQALIDTIAVELRVLAASGAPAALVTPGNYGETFLSAKLGLDAGRAVKCANFIGDAVDLAREAGFSRLLLVGHLGKLVKVAAGILNTHSKYADARMEIFAAHAALCGAPRACIEAIMACVTTDEAVEALARYDLREPVMRSLCARLEQHLMLRAGGSLELGAVVFSNRFGILGKTAHADALLNLLKETDITRGS
ncbi:MAG: cobalt-precorrin-5B (C(1))-methyltransferase CbiD, partial [Oscillospiraceae bacterium]